jgi:hypothetical protein
LKSKREREEERANPYGGIERQLLNTYFSGLYISAKDFLNIGRDMGFSDLALKSRELLIKEIIARADKEGRTDEVANRVIDIINQRVNIYSQLIDAYPKSVSQLSQLVQKANATKRLVRGLGQRSPY